MKNVGIAHSFPERFRSLPIECKNNQVDHFCG
jgi:hypothetical protein